MKRRRNDFGGGGGGLALWLLLVAVAVVSAVPREIQLRFTIRENVGVGYNVGRIGDSLPLDVGNSGEVSYAVIADVEELVSIDEQDGVVSIARHIDRERICPQQQKTSPPCSYSISAIANVGNVRQFFKIKLTITDENDNAPRFESEVINKTIPENAGVGTVIRLTSALDPDVFPYDVKNYELVSKQSRDNGEEEDEFPFVLRNVSNSFGLLIPELELVAKLDRERTTSYKMRIRCYDGGDPPLDGEAEVNVLVTDMNDNSPYFDEDSYEIQVPEDTEVGTKLIQVTAHDRDEGLNAQISYKFSAESTGKESFTIDPSTGWISLQKRLDYEEVKTLHLTIEATDVGSNPLSAFTTVSIQVINVNDEAPLINVKFIGDHPPGTNRIAIPEHSAVGKMIAYVTVTDAGGENVSCAIEDSDKLLLEAVAQNSYILKVGRDLDREVEPEVNVTLVATDDGVPPKTNRTRVTVVLDDINDNSPRFVDGTDVIHVVANEDARPGEAVGRVEARDADEGANSVVTYRWRLVDTVNDKLDGTKDEFVLDPNTGQVRMGSEARPLDAETMNATWYLFNVTATDQGSPATLSTSALVNITVGDVNDNAPKFVFGPLDADDEDGTAAGTGDKDDEADGLYMFAVSEDAVQGKVVGRVVALDADVDKRTNGRVLYEISEDDSDEKGVFEIDPTTGEIKFRGESAKIDLERKRKGATTGAKSNFNLLVRATDGGRDPHPRSAAASVEIRVIDVNDNEPVVVSPRKEDVAYVITSLEAPDSEEPLSSDTARKSVRVVADFDGGADAGAAGRVPITLARVLTKDADRSARHRFGVTGGDQHPAFDIDESSGVLRLNARSQKDLAALEPGCHVIVVTVTDKGPHQVFTARTTVNVYVGTTRPRNGTEVVEQCKRSPFYPKKKEEEKGSDGQTKTSRITMLVIIFGVILIILIAIMIFMCTKYSGCRSNKHRTYNCKDANDLYHQTQSLTQQQQQHPDHNERNSRVENYYSDHNPEGQQQQRHLQMEKKNRASPPSDGGRDSGTGDSVPHQPLDGEYADEGSKLIYHQHPAAHQSFRHHHHQQRAPLHYPPTATSSTPSPHMLTSRCTEECKINGHGDACWMPQNEYVPTEVVTYVQQQPQQQQQYGNYQDMSELGDPAHMRYHSPQQQFYYDPVSNFDNPPPQAMTSQPSYRNSPVMMTSRQLDHYPLHHPHHPYHPHHQSLARQPSFASSSTGGARYPPSAASPTPHQVRYVTQGGGKAYVNLQGGYDDVSSQAGSVSYPHPGAMYPYDGAVDPTNGATGYYDAAAPGGDGEGDYGADDFVAANLMIDPSAGYDEASAASPVPQSAEVGAGGEEGATTGEEKLSTIKEEIDAEEVVAQIDGLLL